MPKYKDRWKPTDAQLKQIEAMAGYGLKESQIAAILGISVSTFQREEKCRDGILSQCLLRGRAVANAKVGETLFKMATSGKCPSATIFWMKVRQRWKEPATAVEFPDEMGNPQKLDGQPKVVFMLPTNGKEVEI